MESIVAYLRQNLPKTIVHPGDLDENHLPLPHPFTTPCFRGELREFYYWDLFYSHLGFSHLGFQHQARHDLENLCALVERYGFIPNGNRTFYLSRSQPPHFGLMVTHYLAQEPADLPFIKRLFSALKTELCFWETMRRSPGGLFHYYAQANPTELLGCADHSRAWRQPLSRSDQLYFGLQFIAECESGWDFCTTYEHDCPSWASIELNSLLVLSYAAAAQCANHLGFAGEHHHFTKKKNTLADRCRRELWDEQRSIFNHRHLAEDRFSSVVHAGCFYPLFAGIATEDQARRSIPVLLEKLERPHGLVAANQSNFSCGQQWDTPNGWSPLTYAAYSGLLRYGHHESARRLALKHNDLIEKVFSETGHLWEKYNVVEGTIEVANEYPMPPMLGWTAGVYMVFKQALASPLSNQSSPLLHHTHA
ncbi:MAG: trehalase family glycosidase [Puniceicoccaceae bacterium]